MSPHTGGHCLVPKSHLAFTDLMEKHDVQQVGTLHSNSNSAVFPGTVK